MIHAIANKSRYLSDDPRSIEKKILILPGPIVHSRKKLFQTDQADTDCYSSRTVVSYWQKSVHLLWRSKPTQGQHE